MNFNIINILSGSSAQNADFFNRYSNAFIYKISGESVYTFKKDKIHLRKGDILFIPKGADYSVEKISFGESRYCLIDFEITKGASRTTPSLITSEGFDKEGLFLQAERLWSYRDDINIFKCYSIFYEIIYNLLKEHNNSSLQNPKNFKKAIDYLKLHIFDMDFKVSHLYEISNVSDTYFRKIFFENFKATPVKYITEQRMAKAKFVILNEPEKKISQIAAEVGYADEFYFSKLFKKSYGKSPNQYKNAFLFKK